MFIAGLGSRKSQLVQRFAIVAVNHTRILPAGEPKIVRLNFPFPGGFRFERSKGPSVEFADALVRTEVNVSRSVLLDAADVITGKSVLFRELRDCLAVVTERALGAAREPMASIMRLKDVAKVLCHFGNSLAFRKRRLLVEPLSGRRFVLSDGAGEMRRDEGESAQKAQPTDGFGRETMGHGWPRDSIFESQIGSPSYRLPRAWAQHDCNSQPPFAPVTGICLQLLPEQDPMAIDRAETKLAHTPRLVRKRLRELRAGGLILGEQRGGV